MLKIRAQSEETLPISYLQAHYWMMKPTWQKRNPTRFPKFCSKSQPTGTLHQTSSYLLVANHGGSLNIIPLSLGENKIKQTFFKYCICFYKGVVMRTVTQVTPEIIWVKTKIKKAENNLELQLINRPDLANYRYHQTSNPSDYRPSFKTAHLASQPWGTAFNIPQQMPSLFAFLLIYGFFFVCEVKVEKLYGKIQIPIRYEVKCYFMIL